MSALLFGLALSVGAPGPKDKPPVSIEGAWVIEKYVLGGTENERENGEAVRLEDGKLAFDGDREVLTYRLDPASDPPRIDLAPVRHKDEMIPGIYKVSGDLLVMCFPKGGKGDRPTKFESPAGTQLVLITLKRVKKD